MAGAGTGTGLLPCPAVPRPSPPPPRPSPLRHPIPGCVLGCVLALSFPIPIPSPVFHRHNEAPVPCCSPRPPVQMLDHQHLGHPWPPPPPSSSSSAPRHPRDEIFAGCASAGAARGAPAEQAAERSPSAASAIRSGRTSVSRPRPQPHRRPEQHRERGGCKSRSPGVWAVPIWHRVLVTMQPVSPGDKVCSP